MLWYELEQFFVFLTIFTWENKPCIHHNLFIFNFSFRFFCAQSGHHHEKQPILALPIPIPNEEKKLS